MLKKLALFAAFTASRAVFAIGQNRHRYRSAQTVLRMRETETGMETRRSQEVGVSVVLAALVAVEALLLPNGKQTGLRSQRETQVNRAPVRAGTKKRRYKSAFSG